MDYLHLQTDGLFWIEFCVGLPHDQSTDYLLKWNMLTGIFDFVFASYLQLPAIAQLWLNTSLGETLNAVILQHRGMVACWTSMAHFLKHIFKRSLCLTALFAQMFLFWTMEIADFLGIQNIFLLSHEKDHINCLLRYPWPSV